MPDTAGQPSPKHLGMNDYIAKPFQPGELLVKAAALMGPCDAKGSSA